MLGLSDIKTEGYQKKEEAGEKSREGSMKKSKDRKYS